MEHYTLMCILLLQGNIKRLTSIQTNKSQIKQTIHKWGRKPYKTSNGLIYLLIKMLFFFFDKGTYLWRPFYQGVCSQQLPERGRNEAVNCYRLLVSIRNTAQLHGSNNDTELEQNNKLYSNYF